MKPLLLVKAFFYELHFELTTSFSHNNNSINYLIRLLNVK